MEKDLFKPKNTGTKTLFQNTLVEKLSRTHILVPIVLLNIYSLFSIYWSIMHARVILQITFGLYIMGIIAWTFTEYMMHKHIYHMSTHTSWRKRFQYNFHGVHHEYPKDKDRLAMPPILSMILATIILFLFYIISGDYAFGFFSGFVTGYTLYIGIHYIIHAYKPPKNVFKALWINHGIHHYKDDERAYGVSSPLWDYILRTLPSRKK